MAFRIQKDFDEYYNIEYYKRETCNFNCHYVFDVRSMFIYHLHNFQTTDNINGF